jgi:hypothetical protein
VSLIVREEEPPDDAVVVVRGGLVSADSIRRTAEVSMAVHSFYGVSVFLALGMTVDGLVRRTPELSPERYKQLRTTTVGAVRSRGFRLLPTAEWPHYDIVLEDLGNETIDALRGCFGPPFPNPGRGETLEGP